MVDSDLARIKIADFNDEDAVGYSDFFTIHDIIYLTRPNGTDDAQDAKILLVGATEAINWSSESKNTGGTGITAVKIEYSIDGGSSWVYPAIIDSTDNDGTHSWQVPDAIGNQVKVRVSDVDDSLVKDVSTNNCSIKPKFTVTQPNASSTWYSGNTANIAWTTSSGNVPNVEIYYSTDNGESWSQVLDEVDPIDSWPYPNDGLFEWKVPSVERTSQAIIKVVSSTDSNAFMNTPLFKIKGQLTVDYPTDTGEVFRCGTTETIMWSTQGIIESVGLKYWYSGSWHAILNESSGVTHVNGGSFDWTVPDIKASDAKIQVYDIGDTAVKGESVNAFDIKPRLVFEGGDEPIGGEIYLYGTPQTISWTTYGPVNNVDIEYSKTNMSSWATPAITSGETNNDSYSWTIPNAVSGECYIRVKDSADADGTYAISGKFRIRTIISLIRPNGGIQVGVEDSVEIKWNQSGDTENIYIYYFDELVGVPLPINEGGTGIMTNPVGHSYWWTVPDFINDNVKVGVADPNDVAGTKDESTAVFPVTGTFTITAPDINSKWDIGSSQTISWGWTGTVDNMNLYYSMNGVDYNSIILLTNLADDPDKLHTYEWYIDPVIVTTPSPNFYIKIADSLDVANAYGVSAKAKIRADFILDAVPQTEFVVGDVYSIGWDNVGYVENVKLHYSNDGGTSWVEPAISEFTTNDGEFAWTIPDDITHEMRVRVMSAIDTDAYDITPSDLRIKGDLWVKAPVANDYWEIGQDYDIKWGWKGTMPEVEITYSINGSDFNPVRKTPGDIDPDGIVPNGSGAGGTSSEYSFTWTIPDEATASAIIRIRDARGDESDVLAESDSDNPLHLVGYLIVNSPVESDRWDVDSTHNIRWEWGGDMPEVKISYSTNGLTGPFIPILENYDIEDDGVIANGAGSGGPGSEHSFEWTIPDDISPNCIIRVADPRDETVKADSGVFKIQGAFTLITPAVGFNDKGTPETNDDIYECRWVTNEVRKVTWTTFGTMPNVDLAYSKDGFESEIPMVGGTNYPNSGNGSFDWTIPDDRSLTVNIRIYDHNDHDVYVEGPIPAGGVSTMKIDYYKVTWDLRDLLTNSPIEGLTVIDTSGWESTGLASPHEHETPAGFWQASWSHQDYGTIVETYLVGWDEDSQTWKGDRTIYRTMETLVVHIWRAYTEFAYDVDGDKMDFTTWLERDGSLVPGSLIVDVSVYDGIYKIKRKTTVVDDVNQKHYYYDDVPTSVKLWIGDRFGEVRTMTDVINDCASYKTGEMDIPAEFSGFFGQNWSPTNYTAGTDTYDTLQDGKVYAVVSYMCIATGATFRTPASFTVTAPKQMDEMKDTINYMLDKPMSEVDAGIQSQLDGQLVVITNTMNQQTIDLTTAVQTTLDAGVIAVQQAAVDVATEAVHIADTLASFESRVDTAIKDLETGAADIAVAGSEMRLAGEEFEETARKYSGRLILPNSVLMGETLGIRYRVIGAGVTPIMDVYDQDGNLIIGSQVLEPIAGVDELYGYDMPMTEGVVEAGKTVTFFVFEEQSGSLEVGSIVVEAMSLTDVAGLASAAPRAASMIQDALDTISSIKVTLSLDAGATNAALLRLQQTIDTLPAVIAREMSQEGPTAAIAKQVEQISTSLNTLAGEEGYDLSAILEKSLNDSPTIQEITGKTENIKGAVGIMREIVERELGGSDEPVVSTSLVSD